MPRIDPRLATLRMADCILDLAGRESPAGVRSCLNQSRGKSELPVEKIEWALDLAASVRRIEPENARRVVALMMATFRGAPLYGRAEVARMMGASEKSVTRWLAAGLAALDAMNGMSQAEPAQLSA